MKIGIVSFAHVHAPAYARCLADLPDVVVAGIADSDGGRGRAAAEKFHTRYFPDYRELLATDVDAVIVCTPNAEHAEVTVAAARAGKHVLCEKPLATTMEDGRSMIEACDAAGVRLQQAFPMRFHPVAMELKEWIAAGRLGQVVAMCGTNRGQLPPGWFLDASLAGGGAVMDHTVHVADLMRWFTGAEFTEVYAEVDTLLHDLRIDDCGSLSMAMSGGIVCSLDPSWSRPETFPTWGDVTLRIVGTEGTVWMDAFRQTGWVYSDNNGRVSERYWGGDANLAMIQGFLKAVAGGEPPRATGEDGLRALEVALAAYQSAQTNRPVALPLA